MDFFAEVQDLDRLQQYLDVDPFSARFKQLNKALCDLLQDWRLVFFHTLNIEVCNLLFYLISQDKESVYNLLKAIDKANGYVFGALTPGNESIWEVMDSEWK